MKLSIVSTLYCSAPYTGEFHACASAAAEAVGNDYEILLVNNGSPGESLNLAVAPTRDDPHVMIVDLSRSFGHQKAMMTGLAHASGDFVSVIDSDLEEEPESACICRTYIPKPGSDPNTIVRQVHGGRRNDHAR